jgi:hypothetical protein
MVGRRRIHRDLFGRAHAGSVDCLVRLSPEVKQGAHGFEAMRNSPLRRSSFGPNWVLDDGELLVAQRTLEAGLFADLKVGDKAPTIAVKTLDGKLLKLEDCRGKYVLLDF